MDMLYNIFRPQRFSEIKGQQVSKTILQNQIKTNNIRHSYILEGLHGSGKTTIGRVFAKAVNCLHPTKDGEPCNECENCKAFNEGRDLNIIEIDVASKRKVEDVTELKSGLNYPPKGKGKYKVYICDEAHMYSKEAWNSLLKTIEEPPADTIFLFLSTEISKFPSTILSRCMRLDFSPIPETELYDNLVYVCEKSKFTYEDSGLKIIAQISKGSARDSLSYLEKCVSFGNGNLTEENIATVLGVIDQANTFLILKHVMEKNITAALEVANKLFSSGKNMVSLSEEILSCMRDILVFLSTKNANLISHNPKYVSAFNVDCSQLSKAMDSVYFLCNNIKGTDNKKTMLEITLIELSNIFNGAKVSEFKVTADNMSNTKPDIQPEKEPEKEQENSLPQDSTKSEKENKPELNDKNNKKTTPSDNNQHVAINHFKYLNKKGLLILKYNSNDPDLKILLQSEIFCTKDKFVIKGEQVKKINQDKLKKYMLELCNVKLNIVFEE